MKPLLTTLAVIGIAFPVAAFEAPAPCPRVPDHLLLAPISPEQAACWDEERRYWALLTCHSETATASFNSYMARYRGRLDRPTNQLRRTCTREHFQAIAEFECRETPVRLSVCIEQRLQRLERLVGEGW